MKWILYILLFIGIERFCYFQTAGFSLSKIIYENSPSSAVDDSSLVTLAGPLQWIGAGKQFYAFETDDGEYVVKFMKWSRRRPLPFLAKIRFFQPLLEKRQKRASSLIESGQLALRELQQETALVIPKPETHFTLIDKLGISHTVKISACHFYVQRRVKLWKDGYSPSLLSSFIQTVSKQCQLGIRNLDPVISRNFGIFQDRVVLLDIGSFQFSPKLSCRAVAHQEIVLELLPLRHFLQRYYPEDLPLFDILLKQELK